MFAWVNVCGFVAAMIAAMWFAVGTADAGERAFPSVGGTPNPALLDAWNIDVAPGGYGAPQGRGTVAEGEEVYFDKCADCHGDFGEGVGRIAGLMGGEGTLQDERPVKTIGSFWPHATTIFDYTKRSMPFGDAQSLSNDEVYAVTAYILFLNDLIPEDTVLDADRLGAIVLPSQSFFVDDPRPDAQPVDGQPCMKNCPTGEVIGRARQVDVTQETRN